MQEGKQGDMIVIDDYRREEKPEINRDEIWKRLEVPGFRVIAIESFMAKS